MSELNGLNSTVEEIIVDSYACNDKSFTVLSLTRFVDLRVFAVGNECFEYVEEVKMIGLNQLERVVIGKHSFRRGTRDDPTRHFYLKNCWRLREVKMGRYSFSDYYVCEIENVPSLEVIEIGDISAESNSFWHASKLELKSDYERMK